MAVIYYWSTKCFVYDGPHVVRRRKYQLLPSREWRFYYRRGRHTWLLHWKPYHGIWLVVERDGDPPGNVVCDSPRPEKIMPVKKRPGQTASDVKQPEAKVTSVILAKLPALREWMVATTYDDGSARKPGMLQVDIYGTQWCLLLRDPNNGLRLPVRGEDLDKTLLLAEQLLSVEEAPWERDKWLSEQLVKKPKK